MSRVTTKDEDTKEKAKETSELLCSMSDEMLRSITTHVTTAKQYVRFCYANKQLASRLAGEKLQGQLRQSALQQFFQVAPHLSRVQIVDLMEDDCLPWAEADVLITTKLWKELHPNEEGLDEHIRTEMLSATSAGARKRRVAYLHVNWERAPKQVETSWQFRTLTKEYKKLLAGWGTHLVTTDPRGAAIMCDTVDSTLQLPFVQLDAQNDNVSCLLVHEDCLYAAAGRDVRKYDLKTGNFLVRMRAPPKPNGMWQGQISDMSLGFTQQQESFLWIIHVDTTIMVWQVQPNLMQLRHWDSPHEPQQAIVQAWRDVGFVASRNTIHVRHAKEGTEVAPRFSTHATVKALALANSELYAGTETGEVQAFQLPQGTATWTINTNCGPCKCLAVRCGQLLYGGQSGFAVLEDVDVLEGHVVFQCATIFSVCHIANTQAAVFARSNRDDVYLCWAAC